MISLSLPPGSVFYSKAFLPEKMKTAYPILALVLFLLQTHLVLNGGSDFGKFINPILLFMVSVGIVLWAFFNISNPHFSHESPRSATGRFEKWLWIAAGSISFLLMYEEIRKIVVKFRDHLRYSDTIDQAETLFNRFAAGEYPYAPIAYSSYTLEPIYMPLHWLPVGLSELVDVDSRFAGWALLVLAGGVWGWGISRISAPVMSKILGLILPSLVIWGFILYGQSELGVTYEPVIVAYYLVLAAGLVSRNLWVVTVGCILCLLSRFTLVFWLPLLLYVLYWEKGWRQTGIVAGTIGIAVLALYIIPFYIQDPQSLYRGLSHYTSATIGDWIGYGNPPVSWTQEAGISFAPIFKALLPGDMAVKVHTTRLIQLVLLLITMAASFWSYHRWRSRINPFVFLLIWLYVIMMVYFFFAPLTYRYYLMSFQMVSAGVFFLIMLGSNKVISSASDGMRRSMP